MKAKIIKRMIRLPLDIAACYEAMRERAAKNANFDLLDFIRKKVGQAIENEKGKKDYDTNQLLRRKDNELH